MSNGICVIVGAGSGVSMGVARRFGREGFRLALLARRQESLNGYAEELSRMNIDARAFSADAGDFGGLRSAFEQIQGDMGGVDVLVYNPALMREMMPSALDAETLISDFRVNVAGALVCAQQVIPHMRDQKKGTILFTGGGLSLYPSPMYASLAVGKAGLRNLTFSMAAELKDAGIHVATVTIAGGVSAGTHFDPDLIAEQYWLLHSQSPDAWETEIVYR